LTQLRQRISVIGRLHPFTRVETMVYLEYRLCKAGYSGPPLFSYGAVDLIAANSKGIPRTINNLCFNALTLGFAKRQKQIDAATMREVMADFDLEDLSTHHSTAPEAPDDALSSFDGISPSNELTYQDFHDAVRAAWGNGAPVKREDRPAEDIPKWAGSNGTPRSVDTVFRMSVQTEEALSTSFDLDHPQGEDDAKSLGSLPTPSVPASGVADQVSPDPWQDESQSEQNLTAVAVANGTGLIDEPSTSNHHAAQLETKNALHVSLKQTTMNATSSQATQHVQSQHPTEANYLSAPLLSKPSMRRKSSRRVLLASWRTAFRTWHDAYKKWMGAADNGRAIFGKTVVAVALALIVSGLVFAWRHPEFMRVPINAAPVAPAPSSMVPLQPSPAIQGSQSSQMRADKVSAPPGKPKRRPVVIIYEQGQTLGAPSLRSLGKFDAKVSPEGNISNQEIKNPNQVIEGTQFPLPGPQVHAESSAPSSGGALNRAQDQP
jgi:hypothetical protein